MMKFTNQVLAYEEVQNRIKYKLARRADMLQNAVKYAENVRNTECTEIFTIQAEIAEMTQDIELLLDLSNHLKDQIFKGIYDDDWRGEDD